MAFAQAALTRRRTIGVLAFSSPFEARIKAPGEPILAERREIERFV